MAGQRGLSIADAVAPDTSRFGRRGEYRPCSACPRRTASRGVLEVAGLLVHDRHHRPRARPNVGERRLDAKALRRSSRSMLGIERDELEARADVFLFALRIVLSPPQATSFLPKNCAKQLRLHPSNAAAPVGGRERKRVTRSGATAVRCRISSRGEQNAGRADSAHALGQFAPRTAGHARHPRRVAHDFFTGGDGMERRGCAMLSPLGAPSTRAKKPSTAAPPRPRAFEHHARRSRGVPVRRRTLEHAAVVVARCAWRFGEVAGPRVSRRSS